MNFFIQVEQARKNSKARYWLMERYRPPEAKFDSIRKIAEILSLEYANSLQDLIDKVEAYTRPVAPKAADSAAAKNRAAAPIVPPGAPDNPSGALIRSGTIKGK
jgi:hypothetical protein